MTLISGRYSYKLKSCILRELSKAKANYSEFSYTDIVNTQLSSVQLFVCLMVFNATFNNISVISWRLFN